MPINMNKPMDDVISNIPVYIENRLRSDMLSSIFYAYGKKLLDENMSFSNVKKSIHNLIKEFKEKNESFCNADYTAKTLESLTNYYNSKQTTNKLVINKFLYECAPYLQNNISNIEIVEDIKAAKESFNTNMSLSFNTEKLAGYYLSLCSKAIKNSTSIDVDFINMFN